MLYIVTIFYRYQISVRGRPANTPYSQHYTVDRVAIFFLIIISYYILLLNRTRYAISGLRAHSDRGV